ncbi:OmpA family protein [Qipengyuania sp. XHP0207]|uniref:OmpA family protein n=1 Tax=Qipengyuania sp. XHP0207 TaxID=3038078 RepID=UPI00241FF5CF|nr:OmpA family protein [Qipengyuania sp. XHP0207]MDG5748184.1 OmpA family protein [Qipengyuania sp. XHP0207]
MRTVMAIKQWFGLGLGVAMLAACGDREPDPAPQPTPSDEPRSIFVDGSGTEPTETEAALGPLETTIGFPDNSGLSEAARAELATVVESPQVAQGGAIILRGHSDSGGGDEANLRASQGRAEIVRNFMVENGIDEERIEIIAFGEQNPVAPNALPDGSPNEEGRRQNRRVEILVESSGEGAESDTASGEPTIAETIADEVEAQRGEQAEQSQ